MLLPELGTYQYLVDWLDQAGMFGRGMNGPEPLEWREILAWAQATDVGAQPWELAEIARLSRLYCEELAAGRDSNRPRPYVTEAEIQEREQADYQAGQQAGILAMFQRMAKK